MPLQETGIKALRGFFYAELRVILNAKQSITCFIFRTLGHVPRNKCKFLTLHETFWLIYPNNSPS